MATFQQVRGHWRDIDLMFLSLQRDLISQDNFAHVGSDEIVSKARNFLQYYHLSSHFAHLHHLFFQPGDNSFGDKAVRRGFIRKVYAILMCQVSGRTWKRSWPYRDFYDFTRCHSSWLTLPWIFSSLSLEWSLPPLCLSATALIRWVRWTLIISIYSEWLW